MAKHSTIQTMKFKRLVRKLNMPRPHVLGHLEMMWQHAHTNQSPVFQCSEDVEIAAEWTGEPGTLADVLLSERWLILCNDDTYEINDYYEHAPRWIQDKMRKRAERSQKRGDMSQGPCGNRVTSHKESAAIPDTNTSTSTYTNTETLGRSIDAESESGSRTRAREASHPTHISAVCTQETEEPDLVERIVAVTSEPDWRDWWTTVLERLDGAGVAGELDGWVRYAENCADPRQRELKDLGELQNPGGFLAKKATTLCRRARVRWPAFPKQRATAQGGG